jgi:dTDP-4-dehydrorhamnose 3,5-epimerase
VYAPACERCVRWDDPALAIEWPLTSGNKPLIAARDARAPLVAQADLY